MRLVFIYLSIISSLTVPGFGRRVVCYFPDWAGYRTGLGKYTPQDLDATKCTNVLYAFASLGSDSSSIKPADSWADNAEHYYIDIVNITKAAKAKPSLSLGGWSDSGGSKYSHLLNSAAKRKEFVNNVITYLDKYGFEGLDLDIEYPTCPQGDCSGGNKDDKMGYVHLIKQLHHEFKKRDWVLSAAISADPGTIDRAYDIQAMNKYLDWIGVMTYDYHSSSEKETGPVSPLKSDHKDILSRMNTENSIKYLIKKGASRNKLMVGIPFYGYSYKLESSSQHGYWAKTVGKGIGGQYTKDKGTLAYYEICQLIKKKKFRRVQNTDLGAYAFHGDDWISYNSQKDILNKVKYVKKAKLGGVIVWDISFDDFTGKFCRRGKYPLLTTISKNIN